MQTQINCIKYTQNFLYIILFLGVIIMPSESLNLPKEIDSNIIKEVLKQIGGGWRTNNICSRQHKIEYREVSGNWKQIDKWSKAQIK